MQHIQSLEHRQLLTTMIETTPLIVRDGRLVVEGTRGDDRIVLSVDDGKFYIAGSTVSYVNLGTRRQPDWRPTSGFTVDLATLKSVQINCGNGNDSVIAGKLRVPITVYAGNGHDTISGGRGNDVLIGGVDIV